MSKDNYDDLADFCGPKDFYDLDGDGHIDAFEAAMREYEKISVNKILL